MRSATRAIRARPTRKGRARATDTAAAGPALSLSRCPDGTDSDQNNVDLVLRPSTPGAANDCPGGDIPPTVTSTIPANGATNVAPGANIAVNFSEAVTVSGSWFGSRA